MSLVLRGAAASALIALAVTLALPFGSDDAQACGGFFARASAGPRRPSLAYEQVLIVYDAAKEKEHFIREVAFRGGSETFGFVVPTPSRPEVAKVEKAPFESLRKSFPFDPPTLAPHVRMGDIGHGAGYGSGGGHVTVLEVSKVGSFTAFVLAADDPKALSKWLRDNGLVSTPEADEWLAHYVRMKFYYVAMRYDPPEEAKEQAKPPPATPPTRASLKSETIAISFSTPLPFYPYLEPKPPADLPFKERLMELWMVSTEAVTPIGSRAAGGKDAWVRPMKPGRQVEHARSTLEAAVDKNVSALFPAGDLVVQTFQDQKFSRAGFGDVLFAPVSGKPLDEARKEKLKPLLGILDKALMPAGQ